MTTGTLIRRQGIDAKVSSDVTEGCIAEENGAPEEQMRKELLEQEFGDEVFFKEHDAYIASGTHFSYIARAQAASTSATDWELAKVQVHELAFNIWHTPKLKRLLNEPLGTPISLTMEEADEIVRLAAGRRPDLPAGKELVKEVRALLGHSLMERLKKAK